MLVLSLVLLSSLCDTQMKHILLLLCIIHEKRVCKSVDKCVKHATAKGGSGRKPLLVHDDCALVLDDKLQVLDDIYRVIHCNS